MPQAHENYNGSSSGSLFRLVHGQGLIRVYFCESLPDAAWPPNLYLQDGGLGSQSEVKSFVTCGKLLLWWVSLFGTHSYSLK
jgi:hypothetical protein